MGLDDAELGGGDTGVVTGVPDVLELQHVLPDRKLIIRCEVPCPLPPLDERHRAAHSHAGNVEISPVLDLVLGLGSDSEVWRDPAD